MKYLFLVLATLFVFSTAGAQTLVIDKKMPKRIRTIFANAFQRLKANGQFIDNNSSDITEEARKYSKISKDTVFHVYLNDNQPILSMEIQYSPKLLPVKIDNYANMRVVNTYSLIFQSWHLNALMIAAIQESGGYSEESQYVSTFDQYLILKQKSSFIKSVALALQSNGQTMYFTQMWASWRDGEYLSVANDGSMGLTLDNSYSNPVVKSVLDFFGRK